MRKNLIFILATCILLSLTLLSFSSPAYADQSLPPIVSTNWLADNSGLEDLVIVDIRPGGAYEAGHIPNAVSIPNEFPVSAWIVMRDGLFLELPGKDDLFNMLGANGISKHSKVVVVTVGPTIPPYPLADATRVADTLIYAGVKSVSILDGGYAKWAAEGRPSTVEAPAINPVAFNGEVDKKMFVTIDQVKKITENPDSKAILVDARDANVYDGSVVEPWTDKPGHIPTAKSLPTPWMWNEDGTYKSEEALRDLASAVVGDDKNQRIVIYCGVGGYASSWWFVMTEVLGYNKVKIYDGAAQEWGMYYDMVLD